MNILYLVFAFLSFIASTYADGYDVGGTDSICWKTDLITKQVVQMPACPSDLKIEFTNPLPSEMRVGTTYYTNYRFYVDENSITPQIIKNVQYEIPHANVHSCFSRVGFCTPFVTNTPSLATHTEAILSNMTSSTYTDFKSSVSLSDPNSYTIIAHGRVIMNNTIKYDVANAIRRVVLPAENEIKIDQSFGDVVLGTVGFAEFIVFVLVVLTLYWRNEKVIRYSQLPFLLIMMISAMVSIGGVLSTNQNYNVDCNIRQWITVFPLIIMYSFLFAKTWRITMLLNNTKLKKVRVKVHHVFIVAFLIIISYIIILLAELSVNQTTLSRVYAPNDIVNYHLQCIGIYDNIFYWLKIAYVGVLLLLGLYMIHKTKNYVALFNESKYIAFSIQNICFICLLVMPTSAAIANEPSSLYILQSFGIIISAVVCVISLMVPKFLLIRSGVKISINGETTQKTQNDSHNKSSVNLSVVSTSTNENLRLVNTNIPNDIIMSFDDVKTDITTLINTRDSGLAVKKEVYEKIVSSVNELNEKIKNTRFVEK